MDGVCRGGPEGVRRDASVCACAAAEAGRLIWFRHASLAKPTRQAAKTCWCLQERPLAVPPHQMEEGALAAARAEYMLDVHRVKAKRLRELQESPSFSLGG